MRIYISIHMSTNENVSMQMNAMSTHTRMHMHTTGASKCASLLICMRIYSSASTYSRACCADSVSVSSYVQHRISIDLALTKTLLSITHKLALICVPTFIEIDIMLS